MKVEGALFGNVKGTAEGEYKRVYCGEIWPKYIHVHRYIYHNEIHYF
jgi:hypothetical protein